MPDGFETPLLAFTPSSEQEVVLLFGLLLPHLPDRYLIEEVHTAFPDCLAYRITSDGKREPIRIEFELVSSNFLLHCHDCAGCDLIVCWEDNLRDFHVPRLALGPIANKLKIFINDHPKYSRQTWTYERFLAEIGPPLRELHRDLLQWSSPKGTICFGSGAKNPSWTFVASIPNQLSCTLFGVYANGSVWPTGFRKLPPDLLQTFVDRLRASEAFRSSLDAGKVDGFQARMSDPGVLPALKSAVEAILA